MATISTSHKLYDTKDIQPMGRVDKHWIGQVYKDVFGNARSGKKFPSQFHYWDQEYCMKYFSVKAFEYGNWLNQRDRWQYLVGCTVSMFDMAEIIGFKTSQIGLKSSLGIAFGARGNGGALAHFEPMSRVINLTRFSESAKVGDQQYLLTGGVGSFGHEWAHALDFHLGRYVDKTTSLNFLSHVITGQMVNRQTHFTIREVPKERLAKAFFNLMLHIIYEKIPGTKNEYRYSKFYKPLYDRVQNGSGLGEYWIMKHELFARAFEVYLFYKSAEKRRQNPFLAKTKYKAIFYSSKAHYQVWKPYMEEILKIAKTKI